jgi:drug/metabolite transporter (DMT)-like permease
MLGNFTPMTINDLTISVIGGLCAGFGVSAIIFGARTLPASIFGTTSYFQLAYGVILGWLFFNQLPTYENLFGILFVILAGGILFFFDKQLKNF